MADGSSWTSLPRWQDIIFWRQIGDGYEIAIRYNVAEESAIVLSFTRLRDRNGDLQALVTAYGADGNSWRNGSNPQDLLMLFQEQATLVWGNHRQRLAGRIAAALRSGSPTSWQLWVEHICQLVVYLWSRGDPIITLANVSPSLQTPYLVWPIVPEGDVAVLYGDGESAKSLTAMFIAVQVATGHELPVFQLRGTPAGVLYLDWETNAEIAARRLYRIANGLGIPAPANVHYRYMVRPLVDDQEMLREVVDRLRIGLVIVDSVGPACGGSTSDDKMIMPLFNAMRNLHCSVLATTHLAKAAIGESNAKATPIGSVYSRNLAREAWLIRRGDLAQESDNHIDIGLFNTKSNEEGRKPSFALRYFFTENTIAMRSIDIAESPTIAEFMSISWRIRRYLQETGKATALAISEALDIDEDNIRRALYRMPDVHVIERGARGRAGTSNVWALKAKEES